MRFSLPLLACTLLVVTASARSDDAAAPAPPAAAAPAPAAQAPTPAPLTPLEKAGKLGSETIVPLGAFTEVALLNSGHNGQLRATRGAEAELTTGALTELIKKIAHEKRPDGSDYKSFPSGHAAGAFSAATLLDAYKPHLKGYGYAWATGIALSRVAARKHYWQDVIAGGLLGHFVTKAFVHRYRAGDDPGSLDSAQSLSAATASSRSRALAFAPVAAAPTSGHWRADLSVQGLTFSKGW